MSPEDGFWLQLMFMIMAGTCWLALRLLLLYRQYQRLGVAVAPGVRPQTRPPRPQAVIGAGAALMQPPDLATTIQTLTRQAPSARYRFPLGWSLVSGHAVLSQAAFVGDVNHILVSAQSDGGKDNWAIGVLLSLAALHPANDVQFCIIDGKGLDFAGWDGHSHVWRAALTPTAIAPTMHALSAERERRRRILSGAGVSKWELYTGGDLPLLVIYVSELSLLHDATSAKVLEQWLNSELAAGRAFGLRYIIATQTASNFATRWRSQISLFMAGFQPSQSQDTPNTALRTQEIAASGAVPPSALPGPPGGAGVFCVVAGREAVNVRTSLIDDGERRQWREALGGASGRSDAEEVLPHTLTMPPEPPEERPERLEAPHVTEAERAAIIAAAHEEPSRRKVCQRVFGTAGGRAWEKVKRVCDEEKCLIGPAPEVVHR
ncbi:MAG: FtsK/SpoIIIE domain-containing protein [Chloroflexales bacterium]